MDGSVLSIGGVATGSGLHTANPEIRRLMSLLSFPKSREATRRPISVRFVGLHDLCLTTIRSGGLNVSFGGDLTAERPLPGSRCLVVQIGGTVGFGHGDRFILRPGEVALVQPDLLLSPIPSGPLLQHIVTIPEARLGPPYERLPPFHRLAPSNLLYLLTGYLDRVMNLSDPMLDTEIASAGDGLLILLRAVLAGSGCGLPQVDWKVAARNKVVAYLDQHFTEALTGEVIAVACGLSERQLFRVFEGGERSLHEVLTCRRMDEARRRVIAAPLGRLCLNEIARLSGFRSGSHFSAAFHRFHGCSPTEFQRTAGERAIAA